MRERLSSEASTVAGMGCSWCSRTPSAAAAAFVVVALIAVALIAAAEAAAAEVAAAGTEDMGC